jgi:hypothetical protein
MVPARAVLVTEAAKEAAGDSFTYKREPLKAQIHEDWTGRTRYEVWRVLLPGLCCRAGRRGAAGRGKS